MSSNLVARARRHRKDSARLLPAVRTAWRPPLETPHVGQAQVLAEREVFNVLCMGRRWGKTRLGVRLLVEPAMEGYPVAWCVPQFEKASDIWLELEKILLPVIRSKDANRWEMELITGGSIKFYSVDRNPEGPRGKKFKRIIIDEAAFTRYLKKCLENAVLPTMLDYPGSDLWLLSSPRGKNPFWEFWKRGTGPEKRPGWKSWHMPTSSNPHISLTRLAELRAEVSERRAKIEYDASFDGGDVYFDDFAEEKDGQEWHVCTPFAVPHWWISTAGMDFGKKIFSWHLFRHDPEGRPFAVREVYLHDSLPKEQAAAVCRALEAEGIPKGEVTIYADPSGFPPENPDDRVGEFPVEAFWAAGLKVIKAQNARIATNTNALQWLHKTDYREAGALDGEPGKCLPSFRIFRGCCPNLVRTIPLMVPLDDNPDDFDSDLEDHAVDSGLRYGLSRFSMPYRSKRRDKPRAVFLEPMPSERTGERVFV